MEAVAVFVAEAALSAAFDALFDKLSSEDVLKYARRNNVKSEVDQWSKLLRKLKCVLDNAEERQMSEEPIKLWLDDLRDLSYDVEDILDEFSYEVLRQKVTAAETEASTSKVRKLIHTSCSCFSPREIKFNLSLGSKMKEITQKFEDITKEKDNLRLTEKAIGESNGVTRERLEPTGSIEESPVYGREKDKETLVDELLSSDSNGKRISVVAIVGMGGLGKTRLAQLVHNDETVSRSFDIKAWVCVSDDFDVLKISVKIIESFTSNPCDMKDLDNVQKKLKDVVHGKKFLLVLDDVWNENSLKWDALIQPLAAGGLGSKVLITTRNKDVASTTSAGFMHHLKELKLEDCVSLLALQAFGVDSFSGHPWLQEVGKEIAKKCDGLPLAAKAIGGLLRGQFDPSEWRAILNSNMWELPPDKCPIIPALRVSYHYLYSYLKRCFAYCAIFPKGYEFDKDELILWWMAEGFLEQSKLVLSDFTAVGDVYFKALLSMSFFQPSTGSSKRSKFVMHDLMNDLAMWVSCGICLHLPRYNETNNDMKLGNPRHLSFVCSFYEVAKRFEKVPTSRGLRTFLALKNPNGATYFSRDILDRVIPNIRCLKLLSLRYNNINELPDSVSYLKHLRHLDMTCTKIRFLPESICGLFNLQVLELNGCCNLVQLPQETRKLINLRVLGISGTKNLTVMPPGIGRLKNLQILSKFIIGENHGLRLNELKDLSLLRGKLSIWGLEKVMDVQEARDANLKAKESLLSLEFKWKWMKETSNIEKDKQVQILDELHPHASLKGLKIDGYNGKHFPKWVGDCRFTNLSTLSLCGCKSGSSLPSLGGLMSLKILEIVGMHEVKKVGKEFLGNASNSTNTFPSLENLILKKMNGLEEWCSDFGSGSEIVFPRLQKMEISDCPVLLGKLPNEFPLLEELIIGRCPNLRNLECRHLSLQKLILEDCSDAALKTLGDLTSLRSLSLKNIRGLICMEDELLSMLGALLELNIESCSELKSLGKSNEEIEGMIVLQRLFICGCHELEALVGLGDQGLLCLPSLESLQIHSARKLVNFGSMRLPSSLKKMRINNCEALEWLPEGFMMDGSSTSEPALEELFIGECPALTTFPGRRFPDLLVDLGIYYCKNLQSMPEFSNSMKKICIIGCHNLQNLPRFPASLASLYIENLTTLAFESTDIGKSVRYQWSSLECGEISKVEEVGSNLEKMFADCSFALESLYIRSCGLRTLPENITLFKRIKELEICSCENLRWLPKQMQELSCLLCLTMEECPNLLLTGQDLPRELEYLEIRGCDKVMEGLFTGGLSHLVSLMYLIIDGGSSVHIKPEAPPVFLPKLQRLTMGNFGNLENLGAAIQLPSSIEQLDIEECPKMKELPIHDLQSNLGHLSISNCPLLKKRCLNRKGAYWPLLSIIPHVRIDDEDFTV